MLSKPIAMNEKVVRKDSYLFLHERQMNLQKTGFLTVAVGSSDILKNTVITCY